jgi:hypothetical protein
MAHAASAALRHLMFLSMSPNMTVGLAAFGVRCTAQSPAFGALYADR